MKPITIKHVYFFFDFCLPSILAVLLIAKYGLIWICAVFALEWMQIIFTNHIIQTPPKRTYDWWKDSMTSISIVIATLLYPIVSRPYELGIAVTALSVVIHFGLYMIISNCVRKQPRQDC